MENGNKVVSCIFQNFYLKNKVKKIDFSYFISMLTCNVNIIYYKMKIYLTRNSIVLLLYSHNLKF